MNSYIKITWGETKLSFSFASLLTMLFSLLAGSMAAVFVSELCLPILVSIELHSYVSLLFGNLFFIGLFLFGGFVLGSSVFGAFAFPAMMFILGYQVSGGILGVVDMLGTKVIPCFMIPWTLMAGVLVLYSGFCFEISKNLFLRRKSADSENVLCWTATLKVFIMGLAAGSAVTLLGSALEYLFFSLLL